jgi:hypothetical protein
MTEDESDGAFWLAFLQSGSGLVDEVKFETGAPPMLTCRGPAKGLETVGR